MKNSPLAPHVRPLLIAASLSLALAGLTGCVVAAAGVGAGVVAYVRGDLEVSLPNDYVDAVAATRQAIKDLEFAKVSEHKDALKAVLVSRTALDKKVEVTLASTGKQLTSIKIRVGLIGDEQLSLAILDKIKSHL